MAFHEVPAAARSGAIREAAQVLKPDGIFVLVDWSKPRFGLMDISWPLFLRLGSDTKDNRKNTYPALCRMHDLMLIKDRYLNSLVRCQVFCKARYRIS